MWPHRGESGNFVQAGKFGHTIANSENPMRLLIMTVSSEFLLFGQLLFCLSSRQLTNIGKKCHCPNLPAVRSYLTLPYIKT